MSGGSPLRGRSVLVTGANGLIGSRLTAVLLESGAQVVVIRRDQPAISALALHGVADRVQLVSGDVCDEGLVTRTLAEYEVDSVFHLAAQTLVGVAAQSPRGTFETNVRGTWIVLEACRSHGVSSVIVASSDKAYGAHRQLPYTESAALEPVYPYDASKAAADLIARSYWHTFGLPVAVTRLANVYGGGDLNRSRLIPEAVGAALAGRSPVIRSDGSPERDFIYIDDAVGAYLAVWEALERGQGRGEAFNAGSGRPHRVCDVVALICRLTGDRVTPDVRGEGVPVNEIDRQWLDCTKLHELTGWSAQVELEEGLRRTIAWYRAHPSALRPLL